MARISIQLDDGSTALELDACFVRGFELDVNQLGALESAPELLAFLTLLQRLAPAELKMAHVLEPVPTPAPSVPEQFNLSLYELVEKAAAEFRRLADVVSEEDYERLLDFADDADTLVEAGRNFTERQVAEAQADAEVPNG